MLLYHKPEAILHPALNQVSATILWSEERVNNKYLVISMFYIILQHLTAFDSQTAIKEHRSAQILKKGRKKGDGVDLLRFYQSQS